MNWKQRYAAEEDSTIYKHPITGNGICGKPGGCAECAKHVSFLKNLMSGELFSGSTEDHATRIGNILDGLTKANGHWMANPFGHMGKSPTQHLAGMIDKLKGHLETIQALNPNELSEGVKKKLSSVFAKINPLKGYAGGKGLDDTNFEEDGELPHL